VTPTSTSTTTPPTTIPTGTVTFTDGSTKLGTVTLDATGAAQLSTSFATAGTQSILASYSGDSSYSPSSATLAETVQAVTTLQLTSSANPSVYGQPVTFTAVIPATTSSSGNTTTNPTSGTVTFTIDMGTPVVVPISSGKAIYTTATLALGTHSVVAAYSGGSLATPSQATLSQVVSQAGSTATLAASGSFVAGQPLTLSAMVGAKAPGAGLPTGNVAFYDGTTLLGTSPIVAAAATNGVLTSANSATLTLTSGLTAGTHVLSAVYAGDTNFTTSTSPSVTKVIAGVASATKLASSANPTAVGQTVTFTATVSQYVTTATGTPITTIPTGTVTFTDGTTKLGTVALDTTGAAQVSETFTTAGAHAIVAVYSGDAVYGPSSATFSETVQAVTTTQLASSVNPSVFGQPVTFTASISTTATSTSAGSTTSQPVAGGTVSFVIDGGTPVSVTVINGKATYTTSAEGVGTHSVVATYSGTSAAMGSQATLSQVVNQASTTTSLTANVSSIPNTAASLTAVVAAKSPGAGKPTGSVAFFDGTTALGTVNITSTSTAVTLSLPAGLGIGTHAFSAVYSGDTNFLASTSATVTKVIAAAPTATTLAASVTQPTVGQTLSLTATVLGSTSNSSAGAKGTPTGSVQFFDGKTLLGTATLTGGVATLTGVSFTTAGTHALSAVYSGDTTYGTSTGTLSESVLAAVNTTPTSNLSLAVRDTIFGGLA
jgi:hypothetical protein